MQCYCAKWNTVKSLDGWIHKEIDRNRHAQRHATAPTLQGQKGQEKLKIQVRLSHVYICFVTSGITDPMDKFFFSGDLIKGKSGIKCYKS